MASDCCPCGDIHITKKSLGTQVGIVQPQAVQRSPEQFYCHFTNDIGYAKSNILIHKLFTKVVLLKSGYTLSVYSVWPLLLGLLSVNVGLNVILLLHLAFT